LSIGCGTAFEEFHFIKHGCTATLVDIDESGTIEPSLMKTSGAGDRNSMNSSIYYIGDALQVHNEINEKFSICYFSSFTPDEFYRSNIQLEYSITAENNKWPDNTNPYSQFVIDVLKNNLKDDGYFILQSYYGGIDLSINNHYVNLANKQLSEIGVIVMDVYYFADSPGVSLTVCKKCDQNNAAKESVKLLRKKDLTQFHGRSDLGAKIVHHYHFGQAQNSYKVEKRSYLNSLLKRLKKQKFFN